jgi:cephalosporin hydroxylase
MKLIIDTHEQTFTLENDGHSRTMPLYEPEAFKLISEQWLKIGWVQKYSYTFTWLGRPIIQLPEDLLRLQEVLYTVKPDVIIETGVAHGGSLIFHASLCKVMEKGRIIGIDVEIRPHNRKAIETHPLSPFITLIEGSSVDQATINAVKALVKPDEKTLVFLDACHSKDHVLAELNAYSPLVSKGSYIVVMDGIMEQVAGAPRTQQDWVWNNPRQAIIEFVKERPDFIIEEPAFLFNEGGISERVTYWPNGFIKRIR